MAKLSAWVKKHLSSKPRAKKQSKDQLPFLPSLRRPVTPTSFDTPACRFFQLPYDIRSEILLIAFGRGTLHVDIVRQGEAWQWRGAVCYRNVYEDERGTVPWAKVYAWSAAWADECLYRYYEGIYAKFPENKVGIMGFLLSCKQAYTEGIDVLYSANSIIIQSEPLLLHLPQLLPPNRLASITFLDIVIEAHRIQQDNGGSSFNVDHLKPILDNIVTHCRHLRGICVSFKVNSRKDEMSDGPALSFLDAFYRSMRLRIMRVDLPWDTYYATRLTMMVEDGSTDNHPREKPTKSPFEKILWRSLDGAQPVVQLRSIERSPLPPLKMPVLDNGDESVESAGYWIVQGDEGPDVMSRSARGCS